MIKRRREKERKREREAKNERKTTRDKKRECVGTERDRQR